MIKLKNILNESKFAFDRKFGESLPTLKDVTEKHQEEKEPIIKLKNTLTEKKELGGAKIHQIDMLTDRNSHTRARAELARHIGDKRLIKAYEGLMYVEDLLRDANDTSGARNRLDKKLFAQAKKMYSDYEQIQGVF